MNQRIILLTKLAGAYPCYIAEQLLNNFTSKQNYQQVQTVLTRQTYLQWMPQEEQILLYLSEDKIFSSNQIFNWLWVNKH